MIPKDTIGYEKKYFDLLFLCRRLLMNEITLSGFKEEVMKEQENEQQE
tara:strand:- start:319 stop:462 length:144 start_codon:yes stop_codon:yes gene_type:complete